MLQKECLSIGFMWQSVQHIGLNAFYTLLYFKSYFFFSTDIGHYLYLREAEFREQYIARIESAFVEVANTCIMAFYKIFGNAVLTVYLREEELHDHEVVLNEPISDYC